MDLQVASVDSPDPVTASHDDKASSNGDQCREAAQNKRNAVKGNKYLRTESSEDACYLKHLDPNVRFTTWGIFVLIYEVSSGLLPTSFSGYKGPFRSYLRLIVDLWSLCKWHCVKYYVSNIWLAIGPSVSFCLASSVLFNIERNLRLNGLDGLFKDGFVDFFRYQIICWFLCGMLTFYAERSLAETRIMIGSHLRAYFLPKLVKASLEIDRKRLTERDGPFPYPHDFPNYVPGLEPFEQVLIRIRCIAAVTLQILAMAVFIHSLEETSDKFVMSSLAISFFIAALLAPQNGAGGKNFGFVTCNKNFKRMHVLFSIAFDFQFCRTLSRDGLTDWLVDEYKRSASALGIVKDIIGILTWGPAPPWYWELPVTIITRYPMYAVSTLRGNITSLQGSGQRGSIMLNMMVTVQSLYRLLDTTPDNGGSIDYLIATSDKGASIELRNVSCAYSQMGPPAIDEVNLSIKAGQLIVITGMNGSGKSTLVNLISGLIRPTSGDVIIDGHEIQRYNRGQLRKAITMVSQTEYIYHTSLRENLLLGTPDGPSRLANDHELDEAATLGGCSDLIKKYGYDTVFTPSNLPNTSIRGYPERPVLDVLKKMDCQPQPIMLSPGEKQRIIASRAFFRLKHENIKLVILDEIANALDTAAEAKVFANFRDIAKVNGQTMVVVTHRLMGIAKQADLIVCMSNGKLVEKGTHQELVASGGEYASLYSAQALN
ncbi:Putative multidrug export ATP-binding/permease protein [Psilocybe cubensis]|uniref:Multidrug export ATP-binding/permease protein n=1 Tax=Psilocybe cubensis TaxID=181762 RepID=A0ACB8H9G9_PSICU|nr:Putative multidrug export ATP-binding/permease protein [Psilocybe cubensis]KAH9484568.1 Putative multidrug export ATP-binding/permease protein [Psilocybe cubensis]